MTELQEARLLGRAINSRWDIPPDEKRSVIQTLLRIAESGEKESARVAACRALIAAEQQNQNDEKDDLQGLKAKLLELALEFGGTIGQLDASQPEGNAGNLGEADGDGKQE